MKKNGLLLIVLFLLTIVSLQVFFGYRSTHTYYESILGSSLHRKLVLWGLCCCCIPLFTVFRKKACSFWGGIIATVGGLYLFMAGYVMMVGSLPGLGFLKLLFNTVVMSALALGFVVGLQALGGRVRGWLYTYSDMHVTHLFLDFGIGLFSFLLVVYLGALLGIIYPVVLGLLAVCLGVVAWYSKKYLYACKQVLAAARDRIGLLLYGSTTVHGGLYYLTKILLWVLVIGIIWYLFNGYQMAYLPYPTAWDANHAYMFYPKMWTLNGGVYWREAAMATVPRLWDMYITFWFGVGTLLEHVTGIAADTYALVMNFLSGIFVLLAGVVLFHELVSLFASARTEKSDETIPTSMIVLGSVVLLSFLTSGMGAFLVFVDNKTDLGVLTFMLLGFIAGLVAIRVYMKQYALAKAVKFYSVVSALLFAGAALSKPTALFDVMSFGMLLWWLFLGVVGAIGLFILVVGVLSLLKFRSIVDYFSSGNGKVLSGIGSVLVLAGSVYSFIKKSAAQLYVSGKFIALWGCVTVGAIVLLKSLYFVPYSLINNRAIEPFDLGKSLLLSQASNRSLQGTTCSLDTLGLGSTQELYTGLQTAEFRSGYNEDVGRYVGYGWKGGSSDRRTSPYISKLFKILPAGCYGSSSAGKLLCQHYESIDTLNYTQLQQIASTLPSDDPIALLINKIVADANNVTGQSLQEQRKYFAQEIRQLKNSAESVIKIEHLDSKGVAYIPYKFLNFLNMTYNWSIQNSASYYTDIGMQWLIALFLAVVGLIYALVTKRKILTGVVSISLFSWLLWHVVAGGIVWYNVGMIVWLICSVIGFFYYLLHDQHDDESFSPYIVLPIIGLFVLVVLLQLRINMFRVVSLGPKMGKQFMQYKSNWNTAALIDDTMRRYPKTSGGYRQDDVFTSQFPHYQEIIELANNRDEDEGLWIAGTYARYFIDHQHYVKYDQMITWIWEYMSDGDPCATYLRLKDQHIKYLILDLNIGTVVQSDGNKSLFDRFFASVNSLTGEIESDGAITMITKLVDAGYARLVSTSSVGAKYAWSLPSATFASVPEDKRLLFKSKMAVSRYSSASPDKNAFLSTLVDIADQRVETGDFVHDLADMLGVQIDRAAMIALIKDGQIHEADVAKLDHDEKSVLEIYMYLNQQKATNPQQYKNELSNMIAKTLYSPSQIVVLELVE